MIDETQQQEHEDNKRTLRQNSALHLYLTQVAEALNDSGYDIKKVIEHAKVEIPWTPISAKEILWRPIQRSMYKKESTTELTKLQEIDQVYEVLNRFLAKLGIESIPFPDKTLEEEQKTIRDN